MHFFYVLLMDFCGDVAYCIVRIPIDIGPLVNVIRWFHARQLVGWTFAQNSYGNYQWTHLSNYRTYAQTDSTNYSASNNSIDRTSNRTPGKPKNGKPTMSQWEQKWTDLGTKDIRYFFNGGSKSFYKPQARTAVGHRNRNAFNFL